MISRFQIPSNQSKGLVGKILSSELRPWNRHTWDIFLELRSLRTPNGHVGFRHWGRRRMWIDMVLSAIWVFLVSTLGVSSRITGLVHEKVDTCVDISMIRCPRFHSFFRRSEACGRTLGSRICSSGQSGPRPWHLEDCCYIFGVTSESIGKERCGKSSCMMLLSTKQVFNFNVDDVVQTFSSRTLQIWKSQNWHLKTQWTGVPQISTTEWTDYNTAFNTISTILV